MQKPIKNEVHETDRQSSFVILFSALFIEGLFCVIWLLSIPSSPGGLIFGLSLNRLLLISLPLVSSLIFFAFLLFVIFQNIGFSENDWGIDHSELCPDLFYFCGDPVNFLMVCSFLLQFTKLCVSSNISVSGHCHWSSGALQLD